MADELKPALTPDEWAARATTDNTARVRKGAVEIGYGCWDYGVVYKTPEQLHALAALCLHGQPFGFTREDVEDLREMLAYADSCISEYQGPRPNPRRKNVPEHEMAPWLQLDRATAAVDRIAALLPPDRG